MDDVVPKASAAPMVLAEKLDATGQERPRGEVRVFHHWCKGCGLCVAFCPQHVFDEDEEGHPVVARPDACNACLWCYLHCPDFAVTVGRVDVANAEDSN